MNNFIKISPLGLKLYTRTGSKCTWDPEHCYLNAWINQQILDIYIYIYICIYIYIYIYLTATGLNNCIDLKSVCYNSQCITWTQEISEIIPEIKRYGHVSQDNSLGAYYQWKYSLEHNSGAQTESSPCIYRTRMASFKDTWSLNNAILVFSYLNVHEIQYFKSMMTSYQIEEDIKSVLAVHPSRWRYPVSDFLKGRIIERKLMSNPMIW